jgi:transcriptional regulator with XRE-family HTH domain
MSDAVQKFLGKRIQFLRKNRGWSQEELASRCHLHRTYVGAMERGERNISLKNIVKIARVFRVPVRNLFPEE